MAKSKKNSSQEPKSKKPKSDKTENPDDSPHVNKDYGLPVPAPAAGSFPKDLGPIISAPLDTRQFKAIELKNGLQALLVSTLVHDLDLNQKCKYKVIEAFNKEVIGILPPASKSSGICCGGSSGDDDPSPREGKCGQKGCNSEKNLKAPSSNGCNRAWVGLLVAVGSFSDPPDVPGMAHLCEHALLLGTPKHPEENQIFQIIHECGGVFNAVTEAEYTYYFFDCDAEHLDKALEVYSDMLTNPLLRPPSIRKEVKAVDSEYSMQNTCDFTRISDFMGYLGKKNHPFSVFHWGDKLSLSDKTLETVKLREWYELNYSSRHMRLCIQAPYTVKDLEKKTAKFFSDIKENCHTPNEDLVREHGTDPYSPESFRKTYLLVPVSNVRMMLIHWCLPADFWQDYKTNPLLYLKTILNTEEKGGICHYLRSKHWVTRFATGCGTGATAYDDTMFRNSFATIYQFRLQLTVDGILNRDKIVLAIFSFIKFHIKQGAQRELFNEIQRTQANLFHYRDREEDEQFGSNTKECAIALQIIPNVNHLLTAGTLITEFNAKLINELLKMMDPRKANIVYLSRTFAEETRLVDIRNGRFVFNWHTITPEKLAELENVKPYPEFQLPTLDTFLSKDLGHPDHPSNFIKFKGREVIYEDPVGRFAITFVSDNPVPCTTTRLPSAVFRLAFLSPAGINENRPILDLWARLLDSFLGNELETASDALYKCNVANISNVLTLTVQGPSFELTLLLDRTLDAFEAFEKHLEADSQFFEDEKTELVESYLNNMLRTEPYPGDILKYVLEKNALSYFHHNQKLNRTTYEEFKQFVKRSMIKMLIDMEVSGSITPEQIEDIKKSLKKLKFRPYRPPLSYSPNRAVLLPLMCNYLRFRVRHPAFQSSVVLSHYQFGPLQTEEDIELWDLILKACTKSAFLVLRTKEAIGYRVKFEKWNKCGCHGINFKAIFKADNFTVEYVNERMNTYLNWFYKSNFQTAKSFKTLTSKYSTKNYNYLRASEMFSENLLPKGKHYRKICLMLIGEKSQKSYPLSFYKKTDAGKPWIVYDACVPAAHPDVKKNLIPDIQEFKKSLPLQPNPSPQPDFGDDVDDD